MSKAILKSRRGIKPPFLVVRGRYTVLLQADQRHLLQQASSNSWRFPPVRFRWKMRSDHRRGKFVFLPALTGCDEAVVDSHDGISLAMAESLSRDKSYRKVTSRYDMPPGAPWRNGKCADYVCGSRVVHRCRVKVLWQTQYPTLPSLAHSFLADPTCTMQESQPRLRIMSCDPLPAMKCFNRPCQ
jgi:hypothetical protein